MSDYRFSMTASAAGAYRNRGYDDALKGVKTPPPVGSEHRRAYLQGWRRGDETREAKRG